MNNKKKRLPPGIEKWLLGEIADIMAKKAVGGGEDFSLINADGMAEISLIIVMKPLGDKIQKFIEKELGDTDDVEFTAQ